MRDDGGSDGACGGGGARGQRRIPRPAADRASASSESLLTLPSRSSPFPHSHSKPPPSPPSALPRPPQAPTPPPPTSPSLLILVPRRAAPRRVAPKSEPHRARGESREREAGEGGRGWRGTAGRRDDWGAQGRRRPAATPRHFQPAAARDSERLGPGVTVRVTVVVRTRAFPASE
jgi:hypothetical protein